MTEATQLEKLDALIASAGATSEARTSWLESYASDCPHCDGIRCICDDFCHACDLHESMCRCRIGDDGERIWSVAS